MSHAGKKGLGATLQNGGVQFRVWAPFAKKVSVATPYVFYDLRNQVEMSKDEDGYWSAFIAGAEAGQTYKYIIDTGEKIIRKNDPRGRALTSSDDGSSIIVDDDIKWENDAFSIPPKNEQIIYELHVGTYNRRDVSTQGTFYDAIEKLDHLAKMGINMIELMPVTSMAFSNGWGYNVSDLFSVEPSYGGRRGLMEFVKACHKRNIGVIVDVVYNHLFSMNLWRFDGWYENNGGGIYFYNDARGYTPWGDHPDYGEDDHIPWNNRPDYGRSEVRDYILDNVRMWFEEYHVDGLRLDSTIYMRNYAGADNNPAHDIPEAWSLLGQITSLAHTLRKNSIIIAEDSSSNSFITKPIAENGCGFDAQWKFNVAHGIRMMFGLKACYGAGLFTEIQSKYNDDAFESVIFCDSHDTAANGEVRFTSAVAPDDPTGHIARQSSLVATAVTLTAPGIPMILQGQEIMQDGSFNDWDDLEWQEARKYKGISLAYTHLINLRRNIYHHTAGLIGQSINVFHADATNHVIAYHRWKNGGAGDDVIVIANFGNTTHEIYELVFPVSGEWQIRFNSSWKGYDKESQSKNIKTIKTDDNGHVTIALPQYCALILSQDA